MNTYSRHPYHFKDEIYYRCFRCEKSLTVGDLKLNNRFCSDCKKHMVNQFIAQVEAEIKLRKGGING